MKSMLIAEPSAAFATSLATRKSGPFLVLFIMLLGISRAPAQTAADERASASGGDDPMFLSPFEVRADEDAGYAATSAQSGTRLRTDLRDIASAISVVTKEFLTDLGARNLEDFLTYTVGTEIGGVGGNNSFSSTPALVGGFEQNYDAEFQSLTPNTRVRGLSSADSTRDFFTTVVPLDTYIVDRVEISRGPNSMLFGLGSPSGIINSSLIRADLRRKRTEVSHRTDQYGSYRAALDHSHVLVRDRWAVRFATVYDKAYFKVRPSYSQTQRGYLTTTYRPFRDTSIRASGEWGQVNSNRPRINPPVDNYSVWFGLGKPAHDLTTGITTLLGTPTLANPLNANGTCNVNILQPQIGGAGASNNMTLVYSDPHSSQLGIPGTNVVGYRSGTVANVRLNANGTLGGESATVGTSDYSRILNQIVHAGDPTQNFWKNQQLIDPSIYDFYNGMLDGPNKWEWGDWSTFNITLEQHFLDRTAGIELAWDRQNMDWGNVTPYAQASAYTIRVDMNLKLANGQPNPNFGRPLAVGFQTNLVAGTDTETGRATGYYNLDLRKRGPKWLGAFLGTHVITGTHTRHALDEERYGGSYLFNSGPDYAIANSGSVPDASSLSRNVSLVHYLGASAATASGPVGGLSSPTGQLPSGLSSVNILWAGADTQATPTSQAQWIEREFSILGNGKKDVNNTRRNTGMRRTRTEVNSTAFITQNRWLNGKVVSTLGWRRDDVHSYDAGTGPRDETTMLGNNDPAVFYPKKVGVQSERTFSWGLVGHAPEFIKRRLPWGTDISLVLNRADNFQPSGQRYDLFDNPLPSVVGESKEHGAMLSTFHGKLVLRYTRYKTTSANATQPMTALQFLADNTQRLLNQIALGANDDNPAGLAAFNEWFASPEGQAVKKVFRLEQNGLEWNYDRRTGQVVSTTDTTSTGDEFEVTFNPTRQWRFTMNAARSEAVRVNTAQDLKRIVESLIPVWDGPAGSLINHTNNVFFGPNGRRNILVPTLQITMQDGAPTTELRRWRWNGVTNYRFAEGPLRNVNIGGAIRWQDKVALGFPVIVDPAAGPVPDVKHPYMGRAETNYDAWVGYSRKIRNRYNWRIQLNLKNSGVGEKLIPVGAQPDGSIYAWRVAEPVKWTLSNSISF